MPLTGTKVILGVSGGIAAYKAVEVCRQLVDAGAHVAPILTEGALRFIGKTTFDALASEPAHVSLFDDSHPIPHTHLGQTADLILVVPATARVLALYAAGISEDLLTNTLLATRAPVLVAPAMHTEMWEHPSVQDNLTLLRSRGVQVVEPGVGRLAGGDIGAGRLADPSDIVRRATEILQGSTVPTATSPAEKDLAGLRVVITAGGTREPIDPVRYISNRSSGKQGYAIAEEARQRGAAVTLISTVQRPVDPAISVVAVSTAGEMADAVLSHLAGLDVLVMAAAVADFRPVQVAADKLKKAAGIPEITLEPTVDILLAVAEQRAADQRLASQTIVGFAAETTDVEANGASKLERKQLDLLVANDVGAPNVGFSHDTNAVTIMAKGTAPQRVALSDKSVVAKAVLDAILAYRHGQVHHDQVVDS